MNILDKQSPSGASGPGSACAASAPPPSGSISAASALRAEECRPTISMGGECLMPNSQLIPPSHTAPQSSTAPSSVSSSSAPHTPIDTLNVANCQPDLTSTLPNRPNVSTPSSVFNSSAPNTPSIGADANISSPALNHQLDYGDQKMFSSGPAPPAQTLAGNNTNAISNPVLSPSPLNVPPPPMCSDNKKAAMSNGTGSNKKLCNNRNQQNSFAGINIKCEGNTGGPHIKNQMNFPAPNNMPGMPCNGSHLNGNVSPFDVENKMGGPYKSEFGGEFPPAISNEMIPPMGSMQRLQNCPMNPVPMQQNMMSNGPNKMCGGGMPPHGMMTKPPPMDSQYMQHQSQIYVFSTALANQAAEAINNGQFDSILDFHLSNPLTKNFLEKHSLKFPMQMHKPNNLWPGNIRQPTRMRGPNPNGMCVRANFGNPCYGPFTNNPPGPGPGGGPQWNGPNGNWPNQSFGPNEMNMKMHPGPDRPGYDQQFHGNYNNVHYQGDMQHLTPQQKQHREKQLAILANLQQEFLPELMESNSRPLSQPPQSNEFPNIDPMMANNPNQGLPMLPDNDQLNHQMIPSDNFSSFPPNNLMNNNQPGNDPWQKANSFQDEKPPQFNGRRKGSQTGNQPNMAHQSPLSQQSMNSPNSCITSSPGTRVPPPPYNSGLRSISSPHPASPAGTSLSLPSPRMHSNDTRQSAYPAGGIRSGPATPSADNANCTLINSPKSAHCNNSSNRQNANTSPGNKKSKSSHDPDLNMLNSFAPKTDLLPVPSPKQIDYNITLEGHELTIHKQPNAHFQENDLLNSNDLSNDLFPNDFANVCSSVNNSQNLPDMNNPNHRFPPNPSCNFDPSNPKFAGPEGPNRYNRFPAEGFRQSNACPPQFNQNEDMSFASNSMADMNFPNSMPPMGHDGPPFPNGQNHNFNDHPDNPMGSTHLQNLQKMTPPFDIANKDGMMPNSKSLPPGMVNASNNHMVPNSMHPNIPQNPNHRMPNFDMPSMPCNDMNEPNSFPGPNMHPPNMQMGYPPNFGPSPRMAGSNLPNDPHFGVHPNNSFNMPMNSSMDQNNPNVPNAMPMMMQGPQPNMRFPVNRPVNPSNTHGTRYNSPNIQVKPDAPNTIQYLPSRPQGPTSAPPNRPPNLDFLQQSLSMSNKPPNNVPYFANNSGPMPMPPRPNMQGHMNFNRAPLMRPQNGPMPGQQSMPPQANEMFGRPPGPNMMNGPNNMPMNAGPPNNFGPPGQVPNKPNSGPAMHDNGQPFNFNKPPFPNTSDPNYAAQFHSFQQQLYATNTRNSSNPRMTSNF